MSSEARGLELRANGSTLDRKIGAAFGKVSVPAAGSARLIVSASCVPVRGAVIAAPAKGRMIAAAETGLVRWVPVMTGPAGTVGRIHS